MKTIEKDKLYIANTYSRFPVSLIRGEGSVLYDETGKEYIDLGSGIAANIFGIADKKWSEAVTGQINQIQHTSNLYYSEPDVRLAELLCLRTGMKKVFFSNSGAEANECAIKTARKYSFEKYGTGRHTIITLKNSFHGRTLTTLSATGQDSFHTGDFAPYTDGFLYAEANNIADIKKLLNENKCAAIMIETIQGEGGVLNLTKEFVHDIDKLAKENDLLMIVDEVQTGNGRSGKLYSYMHYGITPDIVTTAKGLGGGLPLGATLLGEKVMDVLTPGTHGSTFGGNPVCCAGAVSIIERIDEKLLDEINKKSEFIISELSVANGIKSISGRGLMLGIETEKPAKEVINECMLKGVLVLSAKTKVRLLPALNIPFELLEKAIKVIKAVAAEI